MAEVVLDFDDVQSLYLRSLLNAAAYSPSFVQGAAFSDLNMLAGLEPFYDLLEREAIYAELNLKFAGITSAAVFETEVDSEGNASLPQIKGIQHIQY